MWAIARVMEYKARSHIMNIEDFEKSMKSYLLLEAPQGTTTAVFADVEAKDYALIGVSPLASNDEVGAAYRKVAKTWHPDMAGSVEAKAVFESKFAEINEAYSRIKKVRGIQ